VADLKRELNAHYARAERAKKNISTADRQAMETQKLLDKTRDRTARDRLIHVILNAKWRARHNRLVLAAERRRATKLRAMIKADTGRDRTMRWALSRVGITEKPPYSNSGPYITSWIKNGGGEPGWAWCQYFCDAGLKVGGGEQLMTGYTPTVVEWARAREHGLKIVSWKQAEKGDFVYFKFPGVSGDICDHVGLLLSHEGNSVTCVEGNTSPGSSGSQYNGGGVFKKTRSKSIVAYVVRPTYAGDK
jgi:hypothetical protein